jgi:hypothetical protein
MFRSGEFNGWKKRKEIRSAQRAALMAVALVVVRLSLLPSAAQNKQGSAPAKLTPQQIEAVLRAQPQGPVRLSGRIANPRASGEPGDAATIAILRRQRQAADREQQEILSSRAGLGDGSVRPSGQSARGRGAAVSPAQQSAARPPSAGLATAATARCLIPQISTVNGEPQGVEFTPMPAFNLYTIKGCGFGDQPGSVYLEGPFVSGRIPFQVFSKQIHGQWGDTAIIAGVDPQVTGEADQHDLTLVVEPQGKPAIRKQGFRFFAERETVLLQTIPQSAIVFGKSDNADSFFRYDSPSVQKPGMSAGVVRVADAGSGFGNDLGRKTDYFNLASTLAPGFETQSAQLAIPWSFIPKKDTTYSLPKGQDVTGLWNVDWDGGNLAITWHQWPHDAESGDPIVGPPGHLLWISIYSLNVWVMGPRGVDPWGRVALVKPQGSAPASFPAKKP